ncbi:MAG: hypothetical protein IJ793_03095 [Opitutales bacterium]|nr:hypothetical protein [Opitutales bacterium]
MNEETPIAFKEHLQRIQRAKNTASLLEQMNIAEQSMGLLWEKLFDRLCVDETQSDLGTVKELTGILHKLLQTYRQLFAVCQKSASENADNNAWALSEDVLKDIEDQLQML